MSSISEFFTVFAKFVLVLLPGLVFPAIYLSYRRTRLYRIGDIERLANDVSAIRGAADLEASEGLRKQLRDELDSLYNWKNYFVSLTMSCLAAWIATFAALSRAKLDLGIFNIQNSLFARVPPVVFAGIAGAYIANLIDLTEHARIRNLTSSYFQITWVRLLSGAVLGYVAGRLFTDNLAILAAFGVGLAPIKEGADWVLQKARDAWGRQAQSPLVTEPPTLHHLQGMSEEMLNRLAEQNITSTEQLAFASPAKLLARTDLEWVTILDLMDQALLFNYFGQDMDKFRILGIRGSIEMGTLYEEIHSKHAQRREEAEATLRQLRKILPAIDEPSLTHTICTLYEDISVRRLAHLFGSGLEERKQPSLVTRAA